jgi:hypothetical protein
MELMDLEKEKVAYSTWEISRLGIGDKTGGHPQLYSIFHRMYKIPKLTVTCFFMIYRFRGSYYSSIESPSLSGDCSVLWEPAPSLWWLYRIWLIKVYIFEEMESLSIVFSKCLVNGKS